MKIAPNMNNNNTIKSGQNTGLDSIIGPENVKKTQITEPDPEVLGSKPKRRFSAKYKLQIIEQADKCTVPGELGALLRREGLYSPYLQRWRQQLKKGALRNLQPKKRGVKAKVVNPHAQKIAALEKETIKLRKDLKKAQALLELQKKVSDIMGLSLTISKNDELS